MSRRRSVPIIESLPELQALARRHIGTGQGKRLVCLTWLKEHPEGTVAEGSAIAELSERQGRALWEDYCAGGLGRVLGRRMRGKKGAAAPAVLVPSSEGKIAGMSAAELLGFMNAVAGLGEIGDPIRWARGLGDILMEFIPEVDYAVVSVKYNQDYNSRVKTEFQFYQNLFPDGSVIYDYDSMPSKFATNFYEVLIEHGIKQRFPFDRYHFPPAGFDFFVSQTFGKKQAIHISSLLLFRNVHSSPFSLTQLELVENLRPFLTFLFKNLIDREQQKKPGADLLFGAVGRVSGNVGLTNREKEILFLLLCGNTQAEVAGLLYITAGTVQKHTASIYRKTGVHRLSELFARYFTPREYFPEQGGAPG